MKLNPEKQYRRAIRYIIGLQQLLNKENETWTVDGNTWVAIANLKKCLRDHFGEQMSWVIEAEEEGNL